MSRQKGDLLTVSARAPARSYVPGLVAPATALTSRNHPVIKRMRRLQSREERERTGLFFVEGIRFVAAAVQTGAHVEQLVVAPRLLVNPFGRDLAGGLRRAGVPCLDVPPPVFHSIALADAPQGIAAVVRQRWQKLARVQPAGGLCWLAFDAVQSPGNLGTILRTADAVGAAGAIFLGGAADPYDPATVRASMGSLFRQQFVRATPGQLAAWKQRHGCLLVGASPLATVEYRAVTYRRPLVLLMGWERKGLSAQQQALCDVTVRIPMVGSNDSLNLAVATAVMLYEVFNQRRAAV